MPPRGSVPRNLQPGEDSRKAFIPTDSPPGWTRFYALRNVEEEQEVITFGFFDRTVDELRASHGEALVQLQAASETWADDISARMDSHTNEP